MAIYSTDFSQTPTGTIPADWQKGVLDAFVLQVIEDATAIGGKALRLSGSSSAGSYYQALCIPTNTMPGRNRPEVLAKIRINNSFRTLCWRWSTTTSAPQARGVLISLGGEGLGEDSINHHRPGGAVSPGITNTNVPRAPEWFWLRTIHDDVSVRIKFWPDGEPEPAEYMHANSTNLNDNVSEEDTYAGLFTNGLTGAAQLDCDYYAFATEGDPAPGPAAAGPSISVPDIKGPNGAPIGNVDPVTVAIWDNPEANPDNTAPDALITDAAIVDSVLDLNHETIAQNVRVRCRYVHEGSIRLFEVVTPVIQP